MYYKKEALVLIAILVMAATLSIPANIGLATAQTQTEVQVIGFDMADAQKVIPFKARNNPITMTSAAVAGFQILEENIIRLIQGEPFVVQTSPEGELILKVVVSDLNGQNIRELQPVSGSRNYWSTEGLTPGRYFVDVNIEVSRQEMIHETILEILAPGQARLDTAADLTAINNYANNVGNIRNIINKVTNRPGTVNNTKVPPPSPPPNPPGGIITGVPATPFKPGPDGKCPPPSTLTAGNCVLPPGFTIFPKDAPLDIRNGDIIIKEPGREPRVVCPALTIPRPPGPSGPDPNPPIKLSCTIAILPDGSIAVGFVRQSTTVPSVGPAAGGVGAAAGPSPLTQAQVAPSQQPCPIGFQQNPSPTGQSDICVPVIIPPPAATTLQKPPDPRGKAVDDDGGKNKKSSNDGGKNKKSSNDGGKNKKSSNDGGNKGTGKNKKSSKGGGGTSSST